MTKQRDTSFSSRRAERGAITTLYGAGEESREGVIDVLTNLRHYCSREGWDFDHLAEIAALHFGGEGAC